MSNEPLPEPESEQLAALLGEGSVRLVYGLLYRRRRNPPTATEISFFLDAAASAGISADRVLRSLKTQFDIATVIRDGDERYELRGWADHRPSAGRPVLSLRRRAQALALGLCTLCGRSPIRHGVVLEADLRIPPEWGGTTDPENLWPLCEECLKGRRQYLETYASYSEQIRHAASFDEPQRRIGELLLALRDEGVPSELIGIVASAKEFQGTTSGGSGNSGCWDGTTSRPKGTARGSGSRFTTSWFGQRPGRRTYERSSPHRRTGARPDGLPEGTLLAQTARSRFCRPASAVSRAAWIARRILMPTARATGGGKAFPICLYAAVLRP